MKKKITQLRWLAATLMLVAAMLMPSVAWADTITPKKPTTGDGSANNPYQISNKEELYWFAGLVNGDESVCNDVVNQNRAACAKLMNDIVVNSYDDFSNHDWNRIFFSDWFFWTPIGKQEFNIYTGTFDGQGHTISGLYFESCSNYYDQKSKEYDYQNRDYLSFGLFGFNSGTIKNVGVINSYFGWQYNYIGGVCGVNYGTIENCYNEGKVEGKGNDTGGICALNVGTITNCYNLGTVIGEYGTGGVCGDTYGNGTITNCYYLSDTATGGIGSTDVTGSAEAKTADQFKSGEVAYLLNKGDTDGTQTWYQNLSAEGGDAYPNLNKSDKGNRTVYAAYTHGESTPASYNNTVLSYFHTHAYDSSASNEQNGNHDKSYQGEFTWADNNDKTKASVTAIFTCSVCGKVETPELTAVHDESNTNTMANCTKDGYNYYKTSHSFTGETFSSTYRQTLPALGHDMTEIKLVDKIYQKECKRDGCGYADYYATSNGSVVAQLEGGTYKVASFNLADATEYDSGAEFTVTSLAYKRTFYDDKWMAVYVPFAINCSQLENDYEMATINNFHEYEQEDGTYKVVLEVKRVTKGGTIPALTPCLIRMKTAPAADVEKTLTFVDAAFSAAADKSIDCSSVTRYYKFSGTLNGKTELTPATDFVLNAGKLYNTSEKTVLLPQRWYLSATDRNSTSVEPATMLRSISIKVIGDGEATGIENIHVNTELGADASGSTGIYDLQGRKINSEPTKGMYIKNGKKYIK